MYYRHNDQIVENYDNSEDGSEIFRIYIGL